MAFLCKVMSPAAGAGQTKAMLLVVLAGLAFIALLIAQGLRTKRPESAHRRPDPEDLGAEGRRLLRPLKQDRREIERLLEQSSDKPHIVALGREVLQDVDVLIFQTEALAVKANGLKKLMKGRTGAENAVEEIEARLKEAASETEKSAYADALAARRSELDSYSRVQDARGRIEATIYQAHARVSEIKALLVASAVRTSLETDEAQSLREMVDRLQSMRTSLDEAEALLQET